MLYAELFALRAPPAPKDFVPVDADKEYNVVIAKKFINETVEIYVKPAEGAWKPVFDYFMKRKEILKKIDAILDQMPEYDVEVVTEEANEEE